MRAVVCWPVCLSMAYLRARMSQSDTALLPLVAPQNTYQRSVLSCLSPRFAQCPRRLDVLTRSRLVASTIFSNMEASLPRMLHLLFQTSCMAKVASLHMAHVVSEPLAFSTLNHEVYRRFSVWVEDAMIKSLT
ncbi:hypothetical protein K431DRAFT_22418 [Polychaeton citri CBS 116435]|uniref:Uncharacterized protein n=1 Tax=Polychaeton citri CBS 116435 TaxID=1314669 RepID=A0A9P4QEH5_9PEZI|nr:hypothetical protein K431DRAFT_22418 [Polychaeton citri CBS 116435]